MNNTTGIYFKAQFKIFLVLLNKQQYHSAFEISLDLKEGITPSPCLTWNFFIKPGAGFQFNAGPKPASPPG